MFKVINLPWWYYLIALVIGLVVWKTWRWEGGLLVGYVLLVIAETVLFRRTSGSMHFQPELFWSWREWNVQKGQIIGNIVMFIPVGLLAGLLWKSKALFIAVGLSCTIEDLQFVTTRGLMEFDDVLHNCAGALIGFVIAMLIRIIVLKKQDLNQGTNQT